MKLIEKTTLYYLIYISFIFALGTILFYFLIRNVLFSGIDAALHQEKSQLIENLKYEKKFEELRPTENIFIEKTHERKTFEKYDFIKVYEGEQREVTYRELESVFKHGREFYKIYVRQPLEEEEELIRSLLPVEIVLFLILLAGVLLINRIVSNKVWSPFYHLLDRLKDYNINVNRIISHQHSDIDEFNDLSHSIERMTNKIYRDYQSQKEFNENSSHELQTPLAIIRNKLELLIQSRNLTEEEMSIIQSVFDAVSRLTHLNKGLILLSKIDNNQYVAYKTINFKELLEDSIIAFEGLIAEKDINVSLNLKDEVFLTVNPVLIQALIYNLISNSIKHNIPEGTLNFELTASYLKIENSGKPLNEDAELMFERFKKNSDSESSVGLGLSIVKKICDLFNFKVDYSNKGSMHTTVLSFATVTNEVH